MLAIGSAGGTRLRTLVSVAASVLDEGCAPGGRPAARAPGGDTVNAEPGGDDEGASPSWATRVVSSPLVGTPPLLRRSLSRRPSGSGRRPAPQRRRGAPRPALTAPGLPADGPRSRVHTESVERSNLRERHGDGCSRLNLQGCGSGGQRKCLAPPAATVPIDAVKEPRRSQNGDKNVRRTSRLQPGRGRITPLHLLVVAIAVAAATTVQRKPSPPRVRRGEHIPRPRASGPAGHHRRAEGCPAKKTVRFRVGGKLMTKQVSFKYQKVTPLMTCSEATACDTAYQQLTIQPGGYTGWHTHPGPTFDAVAQGEARSTTESRAAHRTSTESAPASCSRRPRFTTRGTRVRTPGLVGVLCASARNVERGYSHRPAPAGGLSEHSLDRCV